ncbi:MAG: 4,5-dihydroxyphthalate decarboxylase [Rhodospirillaceae bacterium]|nr:4,5-dihydroxyphthalate decarboxylase [Rhodospirillaceae bacterium]
MSDLSLTIAISDYDHVRDFADGRIKAEGIDTNFLSFQVEEIFHRFINFREFDVSEVSFAKFVSLKSQGDESLAGLPVFPSRVFRLSSIFVRHDSKLSKPEDLAGKKVGIPEWAQTAAVYSRGYLQHQAGIPLKDIDWYQAGVSTAGRKEKVKLNLPDGINLTPVSEKSLQEMLVDGDIDAMMSAHPPKLFDAGTGEIIRMIKDYQPLEEGYFQETGVLPIMHAIAVRGDVAERHPWALMNLYKAFDEAKNASVARAFEMTASRFPIVWGPHFAEKTAPLFGDEYWPYGIEPNRQTLEAFLLYAYEQGVCHRHLAPEDLFPEQLLTSYKI